MADIEVRINLNAGVSGDEIKSVEFNQETNNVSKAQGSATTKNDGQNLISWGENGEVSISDGFVGGVRATLGKQQGYNGFVFGVVPESKEYSVQFTLLGNNIDSVTFYGDRKANQFPTRAYVDGDTSNYIYSDDAEWTIIFPTSANSHTVTFDMWNRSNYNACITHIGVFVNELILDKRWIKSVESLSQSTGQPESIFYGVISSEGSVQLNDLNGEIKDYCMEGFIQKNKSLNIFAQDNKVYSHVISNIDYDSNEFIANFSLSDSLDALNNIESPSLPLFLNVKLTDLLHVLFARGNLKHPEYGSLEPRDACETPELYNYLQSIYIPFRYLEKGSVRECLDKVCAIAQITMYQKDNGDIVISKARPISNIDKSKIIQIPAKMQLGQPSLSVLPKNKYSKVVVPYNKSNYDYKQIGETISFASYQTPPFKEVVYEDTGEKLQQSTAWKTSEFKDVHNTYNKNINYLAFRIGALGNGSQQYSMFKFSIPKDGRVSDYKHFKFKLTSESLVSVVGTNETLLRVNESSTHDIENVFIASLLYSEEPEQQIIKHFFNVDAGGNIVSAKTDVPQYSLGIINNNNDIVCYVFKPELFDGIEQDDEGFSHASVVNLYDYNGQISILVKTLETIEEQFVVGDGDEVFTFPSNELLTELTYNGDGYLYQEIANNIYDDYKDGKEIVRLSVCCLDYFNMNGEKLVDFSIGEVIQLGDIVKIDKDNLGNSRWKYADGTDKYWRVVGRTFRKHGAPIIDLELQEVHLK